MKFLPNFTKLCFWLYEYAQSMYVMLPFSLLCLSTTDIFGSVHDLKMNWNFITVVEVEGTLELEFQWRMLWWGI